MNMKLKMTQIRCDGDTQMRVKTNALAVKEYAGHMGAGVIFAAIIVYNDGNIYWLADGFHRIEAATSLGWEEIDAEVRSGTVRDARLFAASTNKGHGERLTNADKRRAVEILLADDEWATWTDTKIAHQCGVSDRFVGTVRKESASSNGSKKTRTATRGGKSYPMNTNNIGRSKKPNDAINASAALSADENSKSLMKELSTTVDNNSVEDSDQNDRPPKFDDVNSSPPQVADESNCALEKTAAYVEEDGSNASLAAATSMANIDSVCEQALQSALTKQPFASGQFVLAVIFKAKGLSCDLLNEMVENANQVEARVVMSPAMEAFIAEKEDLDPGTAAQSESISSEKNGHKHRKPSLESDNRMFDM